MSQRLEVTIYMRGEPQGSAKAFVVAGKARITSANSKMKPFRSELTRMALAELGTVEAPMFGKHVPVRVIVQFTFQRPASAKRRLTPAVKPDIDKLQRSVLDALTGVAFLDDAQVVSITAQKLYGPIDKVMVAVEEAA